VRIWIQTPRPSSIQFCALQRRRRRITPHPSGGYDSKNRLLDTLSPEPCCLVHMQPAGASGDMTETDGDDDTTPAGSGGDYSGGTLNMFARTSAHSGAASGGGGRSTRQQQHNKEAQKRYRCGLTVPSGCPVAIDLSMLSFRSCSCRYCSSKAPIVPNSLATWPLWRQIRLVVYPNLHRARAGGCVAFAGRHTQRAAECTSTAQPQQQALCHACLPADLSRWCGWSADGCRPMQMLHWMQPLETLETRVQGAKAGAVGGPGAAGGRDGGAAAAAGGAAPRAGLPGRRQRVSYGSRKRVHD
jgi:hypothetical protein